MRFIHLLNVAVATALMAALFLSSTCRAANGREEASSSRPRRQIPAIQYKNKLDLTRIASLQESWNQGWHPNPDTPIFDGVPLFPVDAEETVVEQALANYRAVGIMGQDATDTIQINYPREGPFRNQLVQQPLDHPVKAMEFFLADHRLHRVRNILQQPSFFLERPLDVSHLPRLNNAPIIYRGRDNVGLMLGALREGRGQFWLAREEGNSLHVVTPILTSNNLVLSEATPEEHQLITKQVADYRRYGSSLGELIWGEKVFPEEALKAFGLKKYRDILRHDQPKEAMVAALQRSRSFLLDAPDGSRYKVKVTNPAARVTEPFSYKVKPDEGGLVGKIVKGVRKLVPR